MSAPKDLDHELGIDLIFPVLWKIEFRRLKLVVAFVA